MTENDKNIFVKMYSELLRVMSSPGLLWFMRQNIAALGGSQGGFRLVATGALPPPFPLGSEDHGGKN